MSITDIARPAVRRLKPYIAAAREPGTVRLNANENPNAGSGLNRYPEVRPVDLTRRLASRFGVQPENLLVTRGSSEAIDLLVRAFCRDGLDNIVVTTPTFEMYRVYADIQGAGVIETALDPDRDFDLDVDRLLAKCTAESRVIFICSPNNPTGTQVSEEKIRAILEQRQDRSVVVLDEAYIEFSDTRSMAHLILQYENLVVLRTLSKALALAGARCGAVLGSPGLIAMLDGILPPYALSQPVVDCISAALTKEQAASGEHDIAGIVRERDRLAALLVRIPSVDKVWPSSSNFLFVRFRDIRKSQSQLHDHNILVREFAANAALENCARITIGTKLENDRLLGALSAEEQ